MTDNTKLLTGKERDGYIAKHFTPDTIIPDALMIESTVTAEEQRAFEKWYDSRGEMMKEFIDEVSDKTSYITEENQYDDFIELLADEGITTAEEFEEAFEVEVEGYGERVFAEFAEELIDSMGYNLQPDFLRNCIDWSLVWYGSLRHDYIAIEYNGNTYFFRNI